MTSAIHKALGKAPLDGVRPWRFADKGDDDDSIVIEDSHEDSDFEEEKHPRDELGKFASSGAGGAPPPPNGKLSARSFFSVERQGLLDLQRGSLKTEEVIGGIEHPGVAKWLSVPEHQPSLYLESRMTGFGVEGEYHEGGRGSITLDANAHAVSLGAEFQKPWGETWGVGDRAMSDPEHTRESDLARVQSNFIHELGHHIHMADLDDQPVTNARTIVKEAYDKVFWANPYANNDIGTRPLFERVARGDVKSPAISRYAATNHKEYFAESFAAYIQHPDALRAHDPIGFQMVKDVLVDRGIESKERP